VLISPLVPCEMLQVLDTGVTRMMVHRVGLVLRHIRKGYYPLCETIAANLRVANKRIEFMGRRSRASNVPGPGNVCPLVVLDPPSASKRCHSLLYHMLYVCVPCVWAQHSLTVAA